MCIFKLEVFLFVASLSASSRSTRACRPFANVIYTHQAQCWLWLLHLHSSIQSYSTECSKEKVRRCKTCFQILTCRNPNTHHVPTARTRTRTMPSNKSKTTTIRAAHEVPHQVAPGMLLVALDSSVLGYDHTSTPSKLLGPRISFLRLTTDDDPNLEPRAPDRSYYARSPRQEQQSSSSSESSPNFDADSYFGGDKDSMESEVAAAESVPAAKPYKTKASSEFSRHDKASFGGNPKRTDYVWEDPSYSYSASYDSEDWAFDDMRSIG